ncbi:unnamed protein product [Onchocerca flexuosa]|uniref:ROTUNDIFOLIA like 8 n=1 Tax=Onchocerca flexuosa TaxID=387005 RepID=A0A183HVB3_9BILA|nr:unnamed protein product [Onchocerca flexuosa]
MIKRYGRGMKQKCCAMLNHVKTDSCSKLELIAYCICI